MKRFAVLQLSGCSGCEVALLDAEEWIAEFDLAYMTLVMSAYHVPEVEVLLVTGGVRTEEDLYKLRRAVRRADQVIAVGTCAISGGIANLGNRPEVREVFLAHEKRIHLPHLLPKCRPIDTLVEVDRYLPGCPPTPELYMAVLRKASDFKARLPAGRGAARRVPGQPGLHVHRHLDPRRLPGAVHHPRPPLRGLPGSIECLYRERIRSLVHQHPSRF
jgi:F420-non-reducing hydrogenase small subunit